MILVDTGPIVALVDRNDPKHNECVSLFVSLAANPLITTIPCLTEAMYFLGKFRDHTAQSAVWRMYDQGKLVITLNTHDDLDQMSRLMDRYSDLPMDIADASLVVAAKTLGIKTILTLDSHFHAYRIDGSTPFEVLP